MILFCQQWSCRDYNLSFSFKLILANCCFFFQKSKLHGDKETESSQNNSFAKTTLAEQKVASSFVVQDAVRNVTIKPETTKRQDDVTGRLQHYTRYTSPRMMKAQARVQDSTMSRHKNEPPKVYNLYKWGCYKWDDSQADSQSVCPSLCSSIITSRLVSQSSSKPVCQWVIWQISQSDRRSEGQTVSPLVSQSVSQSVSHLELLTEIESSVSHSHSRSVI